MLILFFASYAMEAQDINYTLIIDDATCNLTPDGGAEVNVVLLRPPYQYLWDFGATTNAVHNLPAGNYSVTVVDSAGNDTTIAVQIRATGGICRIFSEISFTPNGDHINDVWLLNNIEHYPNNQVLVFNTWGQKVFESTGVYIPWDGTDLLGVPVPDNSYYYFVIGDKNNEDTIVKGVISVIR